MFKFPYFSLLTVTIMRYSLINLMVIAIGFTHALTPSFEFVTRTKANGLIGQPCFEAIKGWTNDQSTGAWYLEAAYGDACEGIILLHPFKAIIGIVHTRTMCPFVLFGLTGNQRHSY